MNKGLMDAAVERIWHKAMDKLDGDLEKDLWAALQKSSDQLVQRRIADLERKLSKVTQTLEESDNYKAFCELKTKLAEAREAIKPLTACELLLKPSSRCDRERCGNCAGCRAAQWMKDNQE